MADVNETLVKEAIRKAEEEAKKMNASVQEDIFNGEKKAESGDNAENITDDSADDTVGTEAESEDVLSEDENAEDGSETEEEIPADGDETDDGTDGEKDKQEKSGKKSGLFGKKNKKDPRDEKIEELNDRLLRNLAEFENFRKRTEKEKSQMFEIGAKSIIEKILPAIDSMRCTWESGFISICSISSKLISSEPYRMTESEISI